MLICVISTKNRKNRLTNFVDSAILINVVARNDGADGPQSGSGCKATVFDNSEEFGKSTDDP